MSSILEPAQLTFTHDVRDVLCLCTHVATHLCKFLTHSSADLSCIRIRIDRKQSGIVPTHMYNVLKERRDSTTVGATVPRLLPRRSDLASRHDAAHARAQFCFARLRVPHANGVRPVDLLNNRRNVFNKNTRTSGYDLIFLSPNDRFTSMVLIINIRCFRFVG